MGIKEYFMLLLLGIALWFLVVVPTWTRSSRMALHCWEGTNSITLLLPLRFCYYLQQQVCCHLFIPAGEDGSVCGGEGSCQVCGVTLRDSVWCLKNKRIDLVSDWTLNKLWLWDQACRICRELLVEFTLTRTYFVWPALALESGKSALDNYDFIFIGCFNNWALKLGTISWL